MIHRNEQEEYMNQLVSEVQRVSEGIDSMMTDAARSDEALNWAKMLQLLEDVVNNPRDLNSIIGLARATRGIERLFQRHQLVVNTLAESNGILHSLLQEAMQWDDQFCSGLQRVSERIDSLMTEVAHSHEALNWAKTVQLLGDVVNNPRDIELVVKLARMSRDVRGIYQLHQNVLNRVAESNALLHQLLSEV